MTFARITAVAALISLTGCTGDMKTRDSMMMHMSKDMTTDCAGKDDARQVPAPDKGKSMKDSKMMDCMSGKDDHAAGSAAKPADPHAGHDGH